MCRTGSICRAVEPHPGVLARPEIHHARCESMAFMPELKAIVDTNIHYFPVI